MVTTAREAIVSIGGGCRRGCCRNCRCLLSKSLDELEMDFAVCLGVHEPRLRLRRLE